MKRGIMLAAVVIVIMAAIVFLEQHPSMIAPGQTIFVASQSERAAVKSMSYPSAVELVAPDGYVNTDNISISSLVGKKVIIVDFWTYTCINCQRTQPYLNAWYDKYHDAGLEIIGVHTPEFEFEKDIDNVRKAVQDGGIKYPVVLDNRYQTWQAYKNHYWPHKYLIDIDGFIVYDHIGEGGYAETEQKIQELLAERNAALGEEMDVDTSMAEVHADTLVARSPEIYFGSSRNKYLANGKSGVEGEQTLVLPAQLSPNRLYLGGMWQIEPEFAHAGTGASVAFSYGAKDVYMVARAVKPVNVEVLVDGEPVSDSMSGSDVSGGILRISDEQLYHIIHDGAYGEHVLTLRNADGFDAFTFTFG